MMIMTTFTKMWAGYTETEYDNNPVDDFYSCKGKFNKASAEWDSRL